MFIKKAVIKIDSKPLQEQDMFLSLYLTTEVVIFE